MEKLIEKLQDIEKMGIVNAREDTETIREAIEMLKKFMWTPIEEAEPIGGEYIMISCANFSLPCIGRFEDGNFYEGDEEKTLRDYDLIPNAWMPLPKNYEWETN